MKWEAGPPRSRKSTCFNESCISEGQSLDKAITYFRNVVPGYDNTVDVVIDVDFDSDCCPDAVLTSDLALDPGLRWNCSPLNNVCIPGGVNGVIMRTVYGGAAAPNIATDGRRNDDCDPIGLEHSFYYGFNGGGCVPWIEFGPTGRADNFLYWLIVDSGCTTSTEQTSWGTIKGLFR